MIPAAESSIEYFGNASTVSPYAIPFRWDDDDWIVVQIDANDGTPLTTLPDYQVALTGATDPDGGQAVLAVAVPNTSTVIISRNTPLSQQKNFTYNGRLSTQQLEGALDKLTMEIQDQARVADENLERTILVPEGETVDELPNADDRAGKWLGFDDEGGVDLKTTLELAAAISGDFEELVDDAQAAATSAAASAGAAASSAAALTPVEAEPENSWWATKALNQFNVLLPPLGTYFAFPYFGDSLAVRVANPLAATLASLIGCGALCGTPLTDPGILDSNFNLVRSATFLANDVALTGYWPGDSAVDLFAATSYAEYTLPTSGKFRSGWRKITVPIFMRSGGGTATLTVVQNGVTTVTATTSGSGTVGQITMLEVTEADGLIPGVDPVIRITATGNPIYFGGVMIWRDRGVVPYKLSNGGDNLATQNTVPTANLTLYKNTFGADLMWHSMFEENATDYATHLTRMATYFPTTTHVCVGTMPYDPANGTAITSAVIRGLAKNAGFAFIDGTKIFKDYATLVLLGWNGDSIHLAAAAYKYLEQTVFTALPYFAPVMEEISRAKDRAKALVTTSFTQPMIFTSGPYKTTSNGAIKDTGDTATANARQAYSVDGTAAGYASDMIMSVASRANAIEHGSPFSVLTRIYGFTINQNVTAWMQVGLSAAAHSAPDKTVKSIGWEMERAQDHGYPAGFGNVAIRIFCYSGSTLINGPWIVTDAFSNTNAHSLFLHYETGKLSLVGCSDNVGGASFRELTSIRATLASTSLTGTVFMGVLSSDAHAGSVNLIDATFIPTVQADPEPWSI